MGARLAFHDAQRSIRGAGFDERIFEHSKQPKLRGDATCSLRFGFELARRQPRILGLQVCGHRRALGVLDERTVSEPWWVKYERNSVKLTWAGRSEELRPEIRRTVGLRLLYDEPFRVLRTAHAGYILRLWGYLQ